MLRRLERLRERAVFSRAARGVSLCLAVAALAGCDANSARPPVEFRVQVTAAEVGTGTVEDLVVATGTLRSVGSLKLTVETPGILNIGRSSSGKRLEEGDRVRAGQVIARVTGESTRLAAALVAHRQRFEAAEEHLRSRKRLFESGLISAEEVRRSQSALEDAKLELDRGILTDDRARLMTPIDGVIVRLARDAAGQPVSDGQLVVPGFELAQVATLDRLIAEVDLVGTDAARVHVGMSARLRHHGLASEHFDGTVVRLAPMVDPVTRALRADVEVDNAAGQLRPGLFVEVSLLAERREGVVVVPRDALAERGGLPVVFVLDGQRVAERKVAVGFRGDQVVEISNGLRPGERIVVQGLETLTDGTRVQVEGN